MVYTNLFSIYHIIFMPKTYEQESAINKRNSNVLVSASAGSGKTTVLIDRVIKRIIEDEIDIDKILVVTFTNASALELKDRLYIRLKKELTKNKEKTSFIKRQLRLLNNSNISTIHAFCLKLIRKNFEKLDLDPNFVICDESKRQILEMKAINLVLEDEYKKEENDNLLKLLQLFNYKEEDLIEEILGLYSYIKCFEQPFLWLKSNIEKYNKNNFTTDLYNLDYGKSIYDDVINKLKMIVAKIDEKQDELLLYEDFEKIRLTLIEDEEKIKNIILNSADSWDKLFRYVSSIDFTKMPRYVGNNIELKEDITNFRKNIIKENIRKIKEVIYAPSSQILQENLSAYPYISYIYYILERFDKKYVKLKTEKNYIDFSDIEHFAYSLLIENGEKTDIAYELINQFEEIYTDEYQDTSFIQEAILNTISSGNNRFMVGDIKQSIYRFRQASPQIFNKKSMEYDIYSGNLNSKNDTKIVLSKNFRSSKSVIDTINFIFENIMSMNAGDSNYTGVDILTCGNEDNFINEKSEINILNLKELKSSSNDGYEDDIDEIEELKDFEIESNFIAKRIEELVRNQGKEYKDIVVLIRNVTGKANVLEEVLKKNSIPVFSDVSSSIFDSEEVRLVLSFLRVLDNKYQDIYLTAIMYSVIGGFNLDELVKIRYQNKNCHLWECIKLFLENEKEDIILIDKVKKFINLIEEFENKVNKMPIGNLLIDLYQNTGIYYQFLLDENAKQRRANLDLILDMCVNFEKQNGGFLNEYIAYIDNMKNKADSSTMQAKTIGEKENVVRIMTIHKSKGLEFNTVILADCSRKYNYKEIKNKFVVHSDLGIGVNIVDRNYNVCYPSVIKQAIKEQVIKEIKNEELRLLYVALTRAKSKLIIYGTLKDYLKVNKELFLMKTSNGKVDPYAVLQNDSYIKNILMAIKNDDSYLKYFNFNIVDVNKHRDYFENKEIKKENFNIEKLETLSKNIPFEEVERIKEKILSKLIDDKEKILDVSQRVSVSELKKNTDVTYSVLDKLPKCIDVNKNKITPARKGTLVHFILQILDFKSINKKSDIKNFIEKKVEENVISSEDAKYIEVDSIYKFIMSDIGRKIMLSNSVSKEKEFILKNNSFSKSAIQGVIDLYFESEGNLILVDFKTDNIVDEEKYIILYKKQLDIYKEALEKLTSKSVKKVYIYSFKLGKEIEVK